MGILPAYFIGSTKPDYYTFFSVQLLGNSDLKMKKITSICANELNLYFNVEFSNCIFTDVELLSVKFIHFL